MAAVGMLEEDVRDDRCVVTVADECESAQTMKRACAKKYIMQLTEWRKEQRRSQAAAVRRGATTTERFDDAYISRYFATCHTKPHINA